MNAQAPAISLLACPRCEYPRLAATAAGYRCERCAVEFPRVGGIPWLFAEPLASLGEWRSRTATTLQTLRHESARLAAAAQSASISELTRRRLRQLAGATQEHARQLERLLLPVLTTARTASYETNLAFRAAAPWDHGLMTYAYNVHRDWSWGEAENEASLRIVVDALAGASPGKTLVLGAGAGRLAYDVHMHGGADATVVLDFNPFLLLLAREITTGGSVTLYELPLAPKSLDQCAVPRTLSAAEPCREGLHYVLADAQRPPFAPGSFDTVITPWLVDILPEPFEHLSRRVNALLRDGGRWINFGSLSFHVADPALQYSPEECVDIVGQTGFDAVRLDDTTMPYLSSPASRHARVEQVVSWRATKRHAVPAAPRPELLPGWLAQGNEPVPLLDVFRAQAPATRIRGYVLSLIDGQRSLKEIVGIFDQQKLMTHEEAEATIRSLLARLYESSQHR
jgi:hypothetical protein